MALRFNCSTLLLWSWCDEAKDIFCWLDIWRRFTIVSLIQIQTHFVKLCCLLHESLVINFLGLLLVSLLLLVNFFCLFSGLGLSLFYHLFVSHLILHLNLLWWLSGFHGLLLNFRLQSLTICWFMFFLCSNFLSQGQCLEHYIFRAHLISIFMLRFFLHHLNLSLNFWDDCLHFRGKLWLHWFWLSLLLLFCRMLHSLSYDLIQRLLLLLQLTTLLLISLFLFLFIKLELLSFLITFALDNVVQVLLLLESLV